MARFALLGTVAVWTFWVTLAPPVLAATVLVPQAPVVLAGTHGKFDLTKVDPVNRRLLACHTGNGTLDVVDIDNGRLVRSIPTGAAQGVAINPVQHRYYVSVSRPPQLVIVDADRLQIIGKIALSGPADLVAFEPGHKRIFVCNDAEPIMWVIDPDARSIVRTPDCQAAGWKTLVSIKTCFSSA